ncbi:MAG: hydroxymethylbilane synthase [Chloroflexi bacterium]|nr:hydroxymethylbilane synthase [Chloroflexota bacterium]
MAESFPIATRQSTLAMRQTVWVRDRLQQAHAGADFPLVTLTTLGDRVRDVPLSRLGDKGIFIKELEAALLDGRAALAVHSLKDLPSTLAPGLGIGAITAREDPRDALVSRTGLRLRELPAGARVGTSSLRRTAQVRSLRPDLVAVDIRGNVDTRLRKVDAGDYDAIVLAAAGLIRLGVADRIVEYLDPSDFLPAPGQAALAVEIREGDARTAEIVAAVDDRDARLAATAERALLERIEGGCQVPAGAYARLAGDRLFLDAMIALPDGSRLVRAQESGPAAAAAEIGRTLGDRLLAMGGAEILRAIRAPA